MLAPMASSTGIGAGSTSRSPAPVTMADLKTSMTEIGLEPTSPDEVEQTESLATAGAQSSKVALIAPSPGQ
jgi:hypothetical protein